MSEANELDWRGEDAQRLNLMVDHVAELSINVKALIERMPGAHSQTVIHKADGIGAWSIASVVACFCTLFLMVLIGIGLAAVRSSDQRRYMQDLAVLDGRLRDLDAWRNVHGNDISALKSDVHQLREKVK